MSHDVRAIANFVLDCAETENVDVSNLALNKIVYFLHVAMLHTYGQPLVSAKIEAWDHGPVFREIYHQFKSFGRLPIKSRARKIDVVSGEYREVREVIGSDEQALLLEHSKRLLRIPAGRLVDMSHTTDGAWHCARYMNGRINPGVEITNEMILSAGSGQARH